MNVGITKLADALGLSKGQASKLAKRGMPTDSVEAAIQWRDENLRPEWRKGADRPVTQKDVRPEVLDQVRHNAPFDAPADDGKPADAPSDNENYWKAKARREQLLADLAEIELAKARAELVELAAVRRGLSEASRMLRDMVLAVPNRIAAQLVATGDAGVAQRMMREELRTALEQFARLSADQLDKAAG